MDRIDFKWMKRGALKKVMLSWAYIAFCGALVGLSSCEIENPTSVREDDVLLARVHNISLYLSELEGMVPPDADSTLFIQSYTERWIKDALLIYEAEKAVPDDLNIDELVNDYRESLLRMHYEEMIVAENLDSIIPQDELLAFYEKNKEQYQLETPIIRCFLVKLPLDAPDRNQFRRLWNDKTQNDSTGLLTYCNQYAEFFLLSDSIWYRIDDIAEQLPPKSINISNIRSPLELNQRDNEYEYYLRIFEGKNKKEIAPLAFIEDQARKAILRKRKMEMLEITKAEMYERALLRNDIQRFID